MVVWMKKDTSFFLMNYDDLWTIFLVAAFQIIDTTKNSTSFRTFSILGGRFIILVAY